MPRKKVDLIRNKESSYYDLGGISLVQIWKAKLTIEERKGLFKGNALKYIIRAGNKKGNSAKKDILKAIDYLNDLVKTLEEEEKAVLIADPKDSNIIREEVFPNDGVPRKGRGGA